MAIREANINVNARKGTFDSDVQQLLTVARSRKVSVEVEATHTGGTRSGEIISVESLEQAEQIVTQIESRLAALTAKPIEIKIKFDGLDSIEAAVSGGGKGSRSSRGAGRSRRASRVDSPGTAEEQRGLAEYKTLQASGGTLEEQRRRTVAADTNRTKSLELQERALKTREDRVLQQEKAVELREKRLQAQELRTNSTLDRAQTSSNKSRAGESEEAVAHAAYQAVEAKKAQDRKVEKEKAVIVPGSYADKQKQFKENYEARQQEKADQRSYQAQLQRKSQEIEEKRVKDEERAANKKLADDRRIKAAEEKDRRIDRRTKAAVKEFGESTKANEVGAFFGGLFSDDFLSGGQRRTAQRATNAKEFAAQQRFAGLPGLEAALLQSKAPSLLNFKNLARPEVAQQIGFGGVFGGLPGIAATAVGGIVGGLPGALAASTIQQTIQGVIIDPLIHAFTERKAEFEEAGRSFAQSILGIQSSLQATTTALGAGGAPASLGASLAFQERKATDIQLEARKRLLPLGIGGQTESTFVQGIQQAAASRGINFSAKGLAEVGGIFGGGIISQRKSLLDNPNLLLRDLQDYVTGGALSKRTILSQLGGFRQASTAVGNATTEEEFLKAIRPIASYEQTVRGSGSVAAVQQRLEGAQDQLRTIAGTELLNIIKEPLANLAKGLGASDTENTFKNLGRVFGEISAVGINLTTAMTGLNNAFSQALGPVGDMFNAAKGLLGGGGAASEKATDGLIAAVKERGAVGSRVSDSQKLQNLLQTGGFGDEVLKYETSQISNPSALLAGLARAQSTFGESPEFKSRLPGLLAAKEGLQEAEFKDRSRIFSSGLGDNALERSSISERIGTLSSQRLANIGELNTNINASKEVVDFQALENKRRTAERQLKASDRRFEDLQAGIETSGLDDTQEQAIKIVDAVGRFAVNTSKALVPSFGTGEFYTGEAENLKTSPVTSTREDRAKAAEEEKRLGNKFAEEAFAAKDAIATGKANQALGSPALTQLAAAGVESEQKILELRKQQLQIMEKDTEIVKQRFDSLVNVFQGFGAAGSGITANLGVRGADRQLEELDKQAQFRQGTRGLIGDFQKGSLASAGTQAREIQDSFRGKDLEALKADLADQDKVGLIKRAGVQRNRIESQFAGISAIGQTAGENATVFNANTLAGQQQISALKQRASFGEREQLFKLANAEAPKGGFRSELEQTLFLQSKRQSAIKYNQNLGQEYDRTTQEGLRGFTQQANDQGLQLARQRSTQLIQEETIKRSNLNREIDSSRASLANFKVNLDASFASKEEQFLSAIDEVKAAGGSTPLGYDLSEERRKDLKLRGASTRANALAAEIGATGVGTQGRGFLNYDPFSAFGIAQRGAQTGLENSVTSSQIGLANLPFESKQAQIANQRNIFELQRSGGAANLPGLLPIPATAGGISKELEQYIPKQEEFDKILSGGGKEGAQADSKVLAQSVKDIQSKILIISGLAIGTAQAAVETKGMVKTIADALKSGETKVKVNL